MQWKIYVLPLLKGLEAKLNVQIRETIGKSKGNENFVSLLRRVKKDMFAELTANDSFPLPLNPHHGKESAHPYTNL